MELKDVLKNYRVEEKISQREFSRRCGLSNSLISLLEMGVNPQTGKKISPDLATYKKLAIGMGISAQELFEKLDKTELIALSYSDLERALDLNDEERDKYNEIYLRVITPKTPEARTLAKGIDKMPQSQREAIMNLLIGLYPGLFDEKGSEEDDT